MNVKELRKALAAYPDDMEVCVHTEWDGWQTVNKIEQGTTQKFSISAHKWTKREILAIAHIGKTNYETD